MDLDQQVTTRNKIIKGLKDTITALTEGKNKFVHCAVDSDNLQENMDTVREKHGDALISLKALEAKVDNLKADMNSTTSNLTMKKDLQSCSDLKERGGRNECIALSVQMVLMTKEHAQMESHLNDAKEVVKCQGRNRSYG